MNRFYLQLLLLFIPLSVISQSVPIKLENKYPVKGYKFAYAASIAQCNFGDTLYFLVKPGNSKKDKFTLHRIITSGGNNSEVMITVNFKKDYGQLFAIDVSAEYFAFLFSNACLVYERKDNEAGFEIAGKPFLEIKPHGETHVYILGKRVIYFKNYNFHPGDEKIKTQLTSVNIQDQKDVVSITPYHDGIPFSINVNFWAEKRDKYLYVASCQQFGFRVYNEKLIQVDSCFMEPEGWKHFPDYKVDFNFDPSKTDMKLVYDHANVASDKIDRLERVIPVSEMLVILMARPPGSGFAYRDFYFMRRSASGWEIQKTIRHQYQQEEISANTIIPNFITNSRILLSNGVIWSTMLYDVSPQSSKLKEYQKQANQELFDKGSCPVYLYRFRYND